MINAIYDPFDVNVFVFVRNKIHSVHMELMNFLGLYDPLSFHILLLGACIVVEELLFFALSLEVSLRTFNKKII